MEPSDQPLNDTYDYDHNLISYHPIPPNTFGICHLPDYRIRFVCEALLHYVRRTCDTKASSLFDYIVNNRSLYEDILNERKYLEIIAAAMTYGFSISDHPKSGVFEGVCASIVTDIEKRLPGYIQPGSPIWDCNEDIIIGYTDLS